MYMYIHVIMMDVYSVCAITGGTTHFIHSSLRAERALEMVVSERASLERRVSSRVRNTGSAGHRERKGGQNFAEGEGRPSQTQSSSIPSSCLP